MTSSRTNEVTMPFEYLLTEAKSQWDTFGLGNTKSNRNRLRVDSIRRLRKLELPPWVWVALVKTAEAHKMEATDGGE